MSDWPAQYDKVFAQVQKLRRSSPVEWIGLCPAHDDHNPSLLLKPAEGRLLVWCGAGCKFPAIRDAMRLTDKDFFMPEDRVPRKFVKAYQYLDANRKLLYEVVRWEPKAFSQRRLNPGYDKTKPATDSNQPFLWNLEGVQKVLYKLPDLMDALEKEPDRWVIVVEGERSVDRLWELGFLATTSSGGAGKWLEQYSDSLKGLKVAIIPDEDAPGLAHVRQIVKGLLGKAKKLVVARLKDLPDSPKDIDDYLDQKAPGEATASADELKARIRDLVTSNADKDPEKALGDPVTPMSVMFLMSRVGLGLKVEKHEIESAIEFMKAL